MIFGAGSSLDPCTIGDPSLKREHPKCGVGSADGAPSTASSAASRPAAGPMPKPCPENPVATREAGQGADRSDVRNHVGRHVDVSAPLLDDLTSRTAGRGGPLRRSPRG